MVRDLERSILKVRYIVVGNMTRTVAKKYEQLRKDAEALQRMAPELRAAHTVSEIEGISYSQRANLLFLADVVSAGSPKSWGSANLGAASERLSFLANGLEADRSVTLSSDAVKLLQRILRQIFELQEPIENLRQVSAALTSDSNKLHLDSKTVENLIKEAITKLALAQAKESPPCLEVKKGSATERVCESADEVKARMLRSESVGLVNKAIFQLQLLKKTATTELQNLTKFGLTDDEKAIAKESAETPEIVINLLTGIPSWITAEREMVQVQPVKPSSDRHHNSKLRLFMAPGWDWFPYVSGVKWILQNFIPELTNDRTRFLVKKKISLVFGLMGEEDQFKVFFRVLPGIVPPNKDDLERESRKRTEAARKLAQL